MSAPEQLLGARPRNLLVGLCALFVGFFVTAELLGAKLWQFSLFGLGPRHFGIGASERFVATAGILAFPLTFVLTDIINEYFGRPLVRLLTWWAIAVNMLLQIVVQAAIRVPAVSFTPNVSDAEVQSAYTLALGQTWTIVVASLIAFLLGQMLDIQVFTWLRRRTGGRWLWLRAQGSTVVSQIADTFVVIFLAFVVLPRLVGSAPMSARTAAEISLTNYLYKFAIAVGVTPVLYFVHALVERYLGHDAAHALVHAAHPADPD